MNEYSICSNPTGDCDSQLEYWWKLQLRKIFGNCQKNFDSWFLPETVLLIPIRRLNNQSGVFLLESEPPWDQAKLTKITPKGLGEIQLLNADTLKKFETGEAV